MAAPGLATTFERDLRSADREFKRDRDLAAKWMHGARPLYGSKNRGVPGEHEPASQDDASFTLMRPRKKWSESSHTPKKSHNVNKPGSNWDLPAGRMRAATHAKEEIQDASSAQSLVDLFPVAQASSPPVGEPHLHEGTSASDLPSLPLPLGIFVKTTGREIEKLVEKEYGVLDDNGQLLRGRKARYNLRHGNSQNLQEDEGFELL